MKTTTTILLFSSLMILGLAMNGQNKQYIPLVEPGKVWFETYTNYSIPSPYGYSYCGRKYLSGDTIIGDKQYMKIYHEQLDIWCTDIILEGPEYAGAIRDEVDLQKTWYVYPGNSNEEMFFDFSLTTGDTITSDTYFGNNGWWEYLIISDVDTVLTPDGVERRRWLFDMEPYGTEESYVIEGVGCSSGLLAPYEVLFEYANFLVSMHTDTVKNFCHEYFPDCQIPTDTCGTVGIKIPMPGLSVSIYPNPALADNPVRISGLPATDDAPAIIEVFDLTGRRLIPAATKQTDFVMNAPEKPGVYFVIVSNSMFKQTLKMVVR